MNTLKIALDFGKWYNSSEFPEDLKNVEDTEILVLAYADKYEINLGNYLDNICDLVDKNKFRYKNINMEVTTAVKIGNLVTEMHNVLNRSYNNGNDKKKAIRNMVKKIYNSGWTKGYHEAGRDEQGY